MKHFTKLFVGILFLILGGTQSGMAQTIHEKLLERAVSPADVAGKDIYVFLYNVDKQQFVHGGGKYGMQTVLSDRGIRFKVLSAGNSGYYLQSAIYNEGQGACMAVDNGDPEESDEERNYHAYKTFLDRKNDQYAVLRFESVRGTDNQYYLETTVSRYKLYYHYASETDADTGGHGYVHVGGVLLGDTPDEDKDKWCLIKREDYNAILGEVSLQGRYNITGLIGNSRFLRNVSDANNLFWSVTNLTSESDYCTTIDPNLGVVEGTGNDYALTYGAFGCLEIGAVAASEDNPVEFYQTIPGLEPGLYMVEAQAFFDKNDYATYKNGAYDTPNTTGASNAYLFANGEETLIPILNEDDQNAFERYVREHDGKLTGNYGKYFRRNVPAAYFLAKGDQYEPDESFHRVRVYVNVGADGTLKLGVNKKGMGGRVYVDNFGLYYIGQNEIGLDAYQRVESEVDKNTYFQPYPFHLSRKFVLNAWNAITLPCDVTGSQIIETFGGDAKLCKLEGVNPQNKDQILFSTVDLFDNYDTPAIVHGECYLIWVTKGPVWEENKEYTFLVKKEGDPEAPSQNMTFPYGNIYTINGVSCPDGISMVTPEQNYKTVTTSTGTLKYTYFYHRPEYAPQYSYVMSGGKMYYLTEGNWNGLLGTCWYITDMGTSSNSKVMAIEGEGGTTDINGIVTEVPGDKAMEGVYNINGQKVADGTSLEGLPKGIYIVNGKKHVVK